MTFNELCVHGERQFASEYIRTEMVEKITQYLQQAGEIDRRRN